MNSVDRFPDRPALWVDQQVYSYSELSQIAARIAGQISGTDSSPEKLVAILGHRSLAAYSSVLGILMARHGYVPLNPNFPSHRLHHMLRDSGVNTLVVCRESYPVVNELFADINRPMVVILPDAERADDLSKAFPLHQFRTPGTSLDASQLTAIGDLNLSSIAYLMYTSGSTGVPKGVEICHQNVCSYVDHINERYALTERDRFSQTFDLTFDLSVHDLFVCWSNGAALYCLPQTDVMAPARFIRKHELTCWFSVPSVAVYMQHFRLLAPGSLPSLRISLFCGEPLLATTAAAWAQAANNSILDNLYGPTEATIAISGFRWEPDRDGKPEYPNGVVPIGHLFPTQRSCLIDRDYHLTASVSEGELCLSGSQVVSGYRNNPQKSNEQFIRIGNESTTWYRTGDWVRRDENGCLYYLSRIDNQIQLRGHRVELQEVENALRINSTCTVLAIAWPPDKVVVETLYGVIQADPDLDSETLINRCRSLLPAYMVPSRIFFIPSIPLNINGKIDRNETCRLISEILNREQQ